MQALAVAGPHGRTPNPLTPDQVREARKLLGWTSYQLAAFSEVGQHVIVAFEARGYVSSSPIRSSEARGHRLGLIRRALEMAGIEFTSGPGDAGVRLRTSSANPG